MTKPPAGKVHTSAPDQAGAQQTDDLPSLDVILDLTRERVAAQLTRITGMDTKAGLVLASASLLTGALATWHGSTNPERYPSFIAGVITDIPLISIVIYLVVIATSFFALIPRGYSISPDPAELWKSYRQQPERLTKRTVRANLADDYQKNEQVIARKIRWTMAAFVALAGEAFLVAVILLLQALG